MVVPSRRKVDPDFFVVKKTAPVYSFVLVHVLTITKELCLRLVIYFVKKNIW